ncbi:chalcone isomerase family protein [Chitinibacter bivalviorum]|uniref:Chalcone isomerase family protein n=1 Tax=Chitinibacter bivalviorum TaxID=2739434 RepID=A0A7H9BGF1_9NEIS|nr:chalcone isomerase family protein [Chitinibacter bivalviorum]QLG87502.1 chalcone isomerase family protein [Chitinibacter bivalviorum]
MLFNLRYKKTNSIALGIALKALFILLLLAIPQGWVLANPWRAELPQAKVLGSGELTWFGLKVYSAKLWSEQKTFDPNSPYALELTYQRRISREQFVETSLDEIKRLFGARYNDAQLKSWAAEMNRAFTDVKDGDQLIGVHLPGVGCRFYNRSQLLADIRDPEFAKAFFAIWFDERTKDSQLRAQLMGVAK